ncbi:LacI family DNA-binding transcriptional regulator [Roseibium marinum]|uniref:LacI family gluconate utilization system Gnt-I transcriptional repressor n=1 Tax=Roseibium marinum TaxID=281252 RepID=A0A2S3V1V8_9HYPH|nr:LacI family DNA-binding transcriptional regulator [Roseibium marinum]POF33895.1 LacI family gluconate utilization system Gnt-I transcriptional repressor [Roseibium marinum]
MEEVAKVAGVSLATVSRALRTPEAVSPKLRTRIEEVSRRLGYAPNRIAGSLAGARTPLIGVIVPSLTNSFFAGTLEQMTTLFEAKGYQLMIGQHGYDTDREERIVAAFASWNPSALVVTGRAHTRNTLNTLSSSACPVVEMWDHGERPLDSGIGFSNRAAGKLAARFFAEQGIAKAAFVGAILDKDDRARARAEGFRQEFLHLTRFEPLIVTANNRELGEGGSALKRVLGQQPETSAIAFSGDMLAVGAMFEADRIGLSIPGDLKILGYGDLDIARNTNPRLTTIRPPHNAIGEAVVRHVLERLEAPDTPSVNLDLGVKLILRETV